MTIPYRTQRVLKRILTILLVVLVALGAIWACWLLWVQRYIVYTADGKAKLDFDLPPISAGQPAVPPENEDIPIAAAAEAAGFTDIPHFTKTFKKYVGKTPKEYRKLHQK